MSTLKVLDTKGSWFISSASFPIVDPESGQRYEPGVPTQGTATKWVEGQPTIQPWKGAPTELPAKTK